MIEDQDPRRDLPGTNAPLAEGRVWLWVKLGVWVASLLVMAGAAWVLSTVRVRIGLPPIPEVSQSEALASLNAPPEAPSPAPAPEMGDEGQTITNPAWLEAPRPVYPWAAQRAGEESGVVRLECRTTTEGRLHACRIAEEAPAGVGFGDAAVKATMKARVRPRQVDGEPTKGKIAFTIRYRLN